MHYQSLRVFELIKQNGEGGGAMKAKIYECRECGQCAGMNDPCVAIESYWHKIPLGCLHPEIGGRPKWSEVKPKRSRRHVVIRCGTNYEVYDKKGYHENVVVMSMTLARRIAAALNRQEGGE